MSSPRLSPQANDLPLSSANPVLFPLSQPSSGLELPRLSNSPQDEQTDDEVAYAEESLDMDQENSEGSYSSAKRYKVPGDPEEYHAALQQAIEADRRNAHLCGSEFELTFETHYATSVRCKQPGEKIVVVGDLDFLGGWNPAAGLEMEWSPGHIWKLTVTLAEGVLPEFRYKYVCVRSNRFRWEAGPNRHFDPESFTTVRGPKVIYHLASKWQV